MKRIITVAMVMAFVFSAGSVFAATAKCTVDSVDGNKVTITCDKADMKAGDSVSVKPAKKGLEGC